MANQGGGRVGWSSPKLPRWSALADNGGAHREAAGGGPRSATPEHETVNAGNQGPCSAGHALEMGSPG
eukprot:11613843-Alexandrium_andersonii.AAC.1